MEEVINNLQGITTSQMGINFMFQLSEDPNPYQAVIEKLKTVFNYRTPMEKMETIVSLRDIISDTVDS